jgi:protein involved in polysaccharide export with SLBB domain
LAQKGAKPSLGGSLESLFETDIPSTTKALGAMSSQSAMPVDNVIDGSQYLVGPGDILILQVVGVLTGEFPLMISPENTILIPNIGEINVDGLTLAAVKDSIKNRIHKRNPNQQAFVILQQPRTVFIAISGNVKSESMMSLPASMKVSSVVALANTPEQKVGGAQSPISPSSLKESAESSSKPKEIRDGYIGSYSERNIIVFHRDGSSTVVDLVRASLLSESLFDPTIREGDKIFVPREKLQVPTISISGAVRRSAILSYRKGDNIRLLLQAGYGLTESADSNRIKLFIPGKTRPVLLNLLDSAQLEMNIQAGSSIVVEQTKESMEAVATVTVTGEVGREGTYIINEGTTRLSNIIDAAQGFTEYAYLPLAYIHRDTGNEYDKQDDALTYRLFQYSDLTSNDTMRYNLDASLRPERVSCDFQKAFQTRLRTQRDSLLKEQHNVLLAAGDVIVVPKNPKTVYVFGQVGNPGFVSYKEGMSLQWYITRAGGFSSGAEEERTRIIKGGTLVWVESNTNIQPGDKIYIPTPKELPPGTDTQKFSAYVGIASAAAFLASTVLNILNRP